MFSLVQFSSLHDTARAKWKILQQKGKAKKHASVAVSFVITHFRLGGIIFNNKIFLKENCIYVQMTSREWKQ